MNLNLKMIKKLLQKLKFEIVLEQIETAASRPSFRYKIEGLLVQKCLNV